MAPRRTRASAAAELQVESAQQVSSPPPEPAAKRQTRKKAPAKSIQVENEANAEALEKKLPSRKRKAPAPKEESPVFGDELPHNLGSLPTPDTDDVDENKETSAAPRKKAKRVAKAKQVKADPEEVDQLAQKAAEIASPDADVKSEVKAENTSPDVKADGKTKKKATKAKSYKLTPGETPYPDYAHPTSEECYEVERILAKKHGKVTAPKSIPLPSLEVTGCGEVPSVLDALIRTRLSAATTGKNSSNAFKGLVKTFGVLQEGVGKGSVDWNKVRLASQPEVYEAIKSGGLANAKSKDIKEILDMVYEENQARCAALKKEKEAEAEGPAGSKNEPTQEKNTEIERAESGVLSLDHLHLLSNEDAFARLVKFPGIGPKTASCVLLFCLQRPSFAVDTHVFRLCQYLAWVPKEVQKGQPPVNRETTFAHCEARVPDDLKYPLHQLLIKHGKECPRCRAATSTNSERWEEGCPIEHLVTRHGAKKGEVSSAGKAAPKTKRAAAVKKGKGKKKVDSDSEEAESSGLSDLESDDDYDELEKAFSEAIENAVTAAVNKAIPIALNHNFEAVVDQAVKEKVEEIEKAMDKKLKRAIRTAELEANLDAAIYLVNQRSFIIEDLPDHQDLPNYPLGLYIKLIASIRIKKDLDSNRRRYFEGQLAAMKKEDQEEEAKKKANDEQQSHV
ncbi:DNA glycosylase, partial [Aureobasidium melanogenum]